MLEAKHSNRLANIPPPIRYVFHLRNAVRGAAAILVVVGIAFCAMWFPRRTVWAVMHAGGTTSVAVCARSVGSGPPVGYLPQFASSFLQQLEITTKDCLRKDADISSVNLTHATVNNDWLPHLRTLMSLELLSLDQKQMGLKLASLSHLQKLRELTLCNASSETDMETLLLLPHLERLHLVNPNKSLRGFAMLKVHPSLRYLDLAVLDSDSQGWSILLQSCDGWTNVESVSIRSLHSVTEGLEALRACGSLRSLEVSAPLAPFDIVAISRIEQLTDLTLNTHKLENDDWLPLRTLWNLRSLQIYASRNGSISLDKLRQSLPDCKIDGGP